MTCNGHERAARFRAARSLVFQVGDEGIEGHNFLSRRSFNCGLDLLTFLAELRDWHDGGEPQMATVGATGEVLAQLAETSILIAEGSPEQAREDQYVAGWRWGMPTALSHFSCDGIEFLSTAESERMQLEKAEREPSPRLWLTNEGQAEQIALPEFSFDPILAETMLSRRTKRDAKGAVTLAELSDCVAAGMRITSSTTNCVGSLPLSMTPSGGARNPYEAYVFARDVEGLERGLYHYSATEHSLAKISDTSPDLGDLVGGQPWASTMSALVMLVAHMQRGMWKYEHGNAYRVMLIEAGHIGQNIALAATSHGLTACPTAAIAHDVVREKIGLCDLFEAPVYCLGLARPSV